MKPDSYFTWEPKPTTVIDTDWRAPLDAPRRRGVIGALSALAARLRLADAN